MKRVKCSRVAPEDNIHNLYTYVLKHDTSHYSQCHSFKPLTLHDVTATKQSTVTDPSENQSLYTEVPPENTKVSTLYTYSIKRSKYHIKRAPSASCCHHLCPFRLQNFNLAHVTGNQ